MFFKLTVSAHRLDRLIINICSTADKWIIDIFYNGDFANSNFTELGFFNISEICWACVAVSRFVKSLS